VSEKMIPFDTSFISVGLLGASVPSSHGIEALKGAQILEIERRILRIEMALRRAGIEVEMVDHPNDR